MIRFFNNHLFLTPLLVVVICFVIYFAFPLLFISTTNNQPYTNFLYSNQQIEKVLIILSGGLIFSNLINYYRISKYASYIYFYAFLLGSLFLGSQFCNWKQILLLSVHFLILQQFFQSYEKKNSTFEIFNICFLFSISCLIHFYTIVFTPFLLFSFFILRSYQIREYGVIILGLLIPFYLNWGLGYVLYGKSLFLIEMYRINIIRDIKNISLWNLSNYLHFSCILIFVLIYIFSRKQIYKKSNIKEQKFISIMEWYSFFCVPYLILSYKEGFHPIYLISFSFLWSMPIQSIEKKFGFEILHLVLWGIGLYLQFRV
jgi:hypothetical protein